MLAAISASLSGAPGSASISTVASFSPAALKAATSRPPIACAASASSFCAVPRPDQQHAVDRDAGGRQQGQVIFGAALEPAGADGAVDRALGQLLDLGGMGSRRLRPSMTPTAKLPVSGNSGFANAIFMLSSAIATGDAPVRSFESRWTQPSWHRHGRAANREPRAATTRKSTKSVDEWA